MINEFGEDVLDIAEEIRRESGRYCGEVSVDLVEQERKYVEDPHKFLMDMHETWHGLSADWAYNCKCVYEAEPDNKRHNLYSLRCGFDFAFREIDEGKIGLTWCCWDMGFTPTAHPLYCQYMPRHMLKGDTVCWQIRRLADTPEEQKRLNSIENTGWRAFDNEVDPEGNGMLKNVELHREIFNPLTDAQKYKDNLKDFFENLYEADGYYEIVRQIAEKYGDSAFDIAVKVFNDDKMIWDEKIMRDPLGVRRIDYSFMGIDVYDVHIASYKKEDAAEICRMYNNQRYKDKNTHIDNSFPEEIFNSSDGIFIARNNNGQNLGFIHCRIAEKNGSVEALIFHEGRIHYVAKAKLLAAADEYFTANGVSTSVLSGMAPWPHYKDGLKGEALISTLENDLPHIASALKAYNK